MGITIDMYKKINYLYMMRFLCIDPIHNLPFSKFPPPINRPPFMSRHISRRLVISQVNLSDKVYHFLPLRFIIVDPLVTYVLYHSDQDKPDRRDMISK